MKPKKKPHGIKQKIREEKKREEYIALAVTAASLITIVSLSGFLINSMLNQPSASPTTNLEPKAAIVDHLSLTYPNQTFITTATNTLEQVGYAVDYYPGEEVTVEFYRNLASRSYGLIILRVHSTATNPDLAEVPVTLFTSERYDSTRYVYEQLTDQIFHVAFSSEEKEKGIIYFGITPLFVTQSMKGKFPNTAVIMMGCQGLSNSLMAQAFVEKGAKVYISWNKPVLASQTDSATTHLLHHFLAEKQTVNQAVAETNKELVPDPSFDSLLLYYPHEAGSYTAQIVVGTLVTGTVYVHHKVPLKERSKNTTLQARTR